MKTRKFNNYMSKEIKAMKPKEVENRRKNSSIHRGEVTR